MNGSRYLKFFAKTSFRKEERNLRERKIWQDSNNFEILISCEREFHGEKKGFIKEKEKKAISFEALISHRNKVLWRNKNFVKRR